MVFIQDRLSTPGEAPVQSEGAVLTLSSAPAERHKPYSLEAQHRPWLLITAPWASIRSQLIICQIAQHTQRGCVFEVAIVFVYIDRFKID